MGTLKKRGYSVVFTAHPSEPYPQGTGIDLGDNFRPIAPPPIGGGVPPAVDYTPVAEAMLQGVLDAGYSAHLVRRDTYVDDPYVPDESP